MSHLRQSVTSVKQRFPAEDTPLNQGASTSGHRRPSLLRQQSIVDTPIITDSSGAMKLTFWV